MLAGCSGWLTHENLSETASEGSHLLLCGHKQWPRLILLLLQLQLLLGRIPLQNAYIS